MKTAFWILIGLFGFTSCLAQEVVIDVQHAAAVVANGTARSAAEGTTNNYAGKIKSDVNNVNLNVSTVVAAQNMIYNALCNVNSALKNGLAVKDIAVVIEDIYSNLDQSVTLGRSDPYLFLFATNFETAMQVRAIALANDVSGFVLKEGSNMLADYNGRDHLLQSVIRQLYIIDGLSYGALRAMYWAKQKGFFASINPYAGWINKDINFANRIIANAKYLKK